MSNSKFLPLTGFPVKEHSEWAYGCFFLDSGAHSLYVDQVIKKKQGYGFFESDAFWEYVDSYAEFVKKHKDGMDYYANVDVIFKPELSWKVLKHLENVHKLNPVPVIHYNTDLKWLSRHLDEGYDYIGLGGLGQTVTKSNYYGWADRVFDYICPYPSRLPIIKVHGFAMTSYDLMVRYPWFSVDSSSWCKSAAFGSIYIPHKRKGSFTFEEAPYDLVVSSDSVNFGNRSMIRQNGGELGMERKILLEWLDYVGVPLGKNDADGNKLEWGVINEFQARGVVNLRFFELLCDWLPKWPWALKISSKKGLLH